VAADRLAVAGRAGCRLSGPRLLRAQDGPSLDLWNAICRGLGITADTGPAGEPQPPLRTPTEIAWTSATLALIASGNERNGANVALNCSACHGDQGVSPSNTIPTLAGMDAAAIYKQLDDFRSKKRLWDVMNGMAAALTVQDLVDVAKYFAGRTAGLPPVGGEGLPEAGHSLRQSDPVVRLVFAGDPQRGIPPCSMPWPRRSQTWGAGIARPARRLH
jgi:cytochrome c553